MTGTRRALLLPFLAAICACTLCRPAEAVVMTGLPAGAPVVPAPGSETVPPPPVTGEVSGMVRNVGGFPAVNVLVLFWKPGVPDSLIEVRTGVMGTYRLNLGDGNWRGCACGAAEGYAPLFWEASVSGGRVTSFSEVPERSPVIRSASAATSSAAGNLAPGDTVTLEGEGFGCSGKTWIELPGPVRLEATSFLEQGDGRVRFRIPPFPATVLSVTPVREILVTYVHGGSRSAPFPVRGGQVLSAPAGSPVPQAVPGIGSAEWPTQTPLQNLTVPRR